MEYTKFPVNLRTYILKQIFQQNTKGIGIQNMGILADNITAGNYKGADIKVKGNLKAMILQVLRSR